jgi:hypothetical protein
MTATFWEYDSRIGRRWNLDTKPNTSISPYACFANNPITFSDIYGDTLRVESESLEVMNNMVNSVATQYQSGLVIDKTHSGCSKDGGCFYQTIVGFDTIISSNEKKNEANATIQVDLELIITSKEMTYLQSVKPIEKQVQDIDTYGGAFTAGQNVYMSENFFTGDHSWFLTDKIEPKYEFYTDKYRHGETIPGIVVSWFGDETTNRERRNHFINASEAIGHEFHHRARLLRDETTLNVGLEENITRQFINEWGAYHGVPLRPFHQEDIYPGIFKETSPGFWEFQKSTR